MPAHLHRPSHLSPQHSPTPPLMRLSTLAWLILLTLVTAFSLWGFFYTQAQAQASARQNELQKQYSILEESNISLSFEEKTFVASKEDIRHWLVSPRNFSTLAGRDYSSAQDTRRHLLRAEKIGNWVRAQGEKIMIPVKNGKRVLNDKGQLVRLIAEGSVGRAPSNNDTITNQIYASLVEAHDFLGTFSVKTVQPIFEDQKGKLPPLNYEAKAGEKWIDINLSTATVSAYIGSDLIHGPVAAIPGHRLAPTETGVFHIYHKVEKQTMRGVGFDGPYAETAPWIMYYDGDYALHSAPWRSSFVYSPESGSHGCVNMKVSDAKTLYDWAPVGTTVVVHR